MNVKELLELIGDSPNLFTTEGILKEAYKKNYYPVLEFASKNAFFMETLLGTATLTGLKGLRVIDKCLALLL